MVFERRSVLALGLALVVGLASPVRAAGTEEAASRFIDGLASQAIEALTGAQVSPQERASRFRVLLRDHFAVETIARWVLGRHWRNASPAEQKEYLSLFEDLMVAMYADRFVNYSGEKLVVRQASLAQDGDVVVATDIQSPGGTQPFRVDWRVRERDSRYQIVDVIVDGISMGQTQRSEFASFIRQNGGTVEGLNAELRKRLN